CLLPPRRPPPLPTLFPYTTLFRSSPKKIASVNSRISRLILTSKIHPPLQAHHFLDNTISHFYRPYQDQHIKCQLCDVVPNHRGRSEEHTSELQSRFDLVCRLLLEK